MKRLTRTVPAPEDLAIDQVIGVPQDAEIQLDLRLESVMEGVLVTGTARALLAGECVRCLEQFERELETGFQEMYSYPDDDRTGGRHAAVAGNPQMRGWSAGDDAEEEDTLHLEGDLFDLEPVLRDAVVLELPLQPVCREDCPGLCSECGARLADDPDHHHEVTDIRWAALQDLIPDEKQEK
jgi:uncharacterized protein